jgi:hypothetical protein
MRRKNILLSNSLAIPWKTEKARRVSQAPRHAPAPEDREGACGSRARSAQAGTWPADAGDDDSRRKLLWKKTRGSFPGLGAAEVVREQPGYFTFIPTGTNMTNEEKALIGATIASAVKDDLARIRACNRAYANLRATYGRDMETDTEGEWMRLDHAAITAGWSPGYLIERFTNFMRSQGFFPVNRA